MYIIGHSDLKRILYFLSLYLSALPDPDEDVCVHVEEGDEGQDPRRQGRVPRQRQGVPENKGRVLPEIQGELSNVII